MRKLTRLIHEAEATARLRGHSLSMFRALVPKVSAEASCNRCKATVVVDTKPAPNGIDIGGEAVAINCHETR